MKKLIFLLLLIPVLYGVTNTNTSTNYIDRSAIYIPVGKTFLSPFTGWFFSVSSTRRLLAADTENPFLKLENEKLKGELEALKFKIQGLEYILDMNTLQLGVYREYFDINKGNNKKKFELSKETSYILGILSGIGICALTYWGIDKLQ